MTLQGENPFKAKAEEDKLIELLWPVLKEVRAVSGFTQFKTPEDTRGRIQHILFELRRVKV